MGIIWGQGEAFIKKNLFLAGETAAAAALSLVFVLLQVGRCQIRDTSANLHVFARPRMCACAPACIRAQVYDPACSD